MSQVGPERGQSDAPAPPSLRSQRDTLELINAELAGRLARQSAAGGQIDTKAALVAGAVLAAVQFLAARADAAGSLVVLAYTAYLLAFLAAVCTYAVRKYDEVPEPGPLVRELAHCPVEVTLAQLAVRRVKAFEANEKRYSQKAMCWRLSAGLLVAGITLSTVSIMQTEQMSEQPDPTPQDAQPVDVDAPMATGEAFLGAYDNPRLAGTESKGDQTPYETATQEPPSETR